MSTNHHARFVSVDPLPDFRTRWWGYDRDQVDEFLESVAAHQQRLQNGLASLEALVATRQQGRADEIVARARRHADEIRATAEHEALRILREAESQAEFLQHERLHVHGRELDRLMILRKDIESCLEGAVSALGKARGLSQAHEETEMSTRAPDSEIPVPASAQSMPEEAADPGAMNRHRALGWIAFVFWCSLMLAIALMLSVQRPVELGASGSAAVLSDLPPGTAVEPTASPLPVESRSPPQLSSLTVTLLAQRQCWISTTIDGGTPRERLLRPSESLVLHARDELTLKVGNAGALSLLINNQPAAPLGAEGQVVTRRITRTNYRAPLTPESGRATIAVAQVQ